MIDIGADLQRAFDEGYEKGKADGTMIYGNEHNCMMTIFGECSYEETGCGDCAVVEKARKALLADADRKAQERERRNEMEKVLMLELVLIDYNGDVDDVESEVDFVEGILEDRGFNVLIDRKNVQAFPLCFDQEAEYNKIEYDYRKAIMEVYRDAWKATLRKEGEDSDDE